MTFDKIINENILKQDLLANELINTIDKNQQELKLDPALIYHNFPILKDNEQNNVLINVLLLSNRYGLVIFMCTSETGRTLERLNLTVENLENIYALLFSKLIRSKILRNGLNKIKINIYPVIFIPLYEESIDNLKNFGNIVKFIKNKADLINFFKEIDVIDINETEYKETISIIEASNAIIKPQERKITKKDPLIKGIILNEIEKEIANFDNEQRQAALFIIDGPQRIRGLAGSGKTVVLAMKAAQIHLLEPEAKIVYTFYTKSLYDIIKRFITRFYRQFADNDPNWEKIQILHAWGGKNVPGVYYNICKENDITPLSYKEAKIENEIDPFNYACKVIYDNSLKIIYDYTIIDEGQDFPAYFYRLCRKVTKNNRVIWAYDECQNIFNTSIQDPKMTFGKDNDGNYYIDFLKLPKNSDIILYKCYRNPRRVLIYAFALGFGIYSNQIVQLPQNNNHWKDWGFEVTEGNMREGDRMIISRPEINSPLTKNKYLESSETVQLEKFNNLEDECNYIVKNILIDINNELLPQDILVICLDDFNIHAYFRKITSKLLPYKIKTFNLLTAPSNSIKFSLPDHITLTTVYRAKGNETGSVYVIGVNSIFNYRNSLRNRNKLFTALTRSKAWVKISGIGEPMDLCIEEVKMIEKNYPQLQFVMPNPKSLLTIQRDLEDMQAKYNEYLKEVREIAAKLKLDPEDIKNVLEKDNLD